MTFGYSAKVPLALSAVRNLIASLDSELTMNKHVHKLCSATFFRLYKPKAYTKVDAEREMRSTSARLYYQSDGLL